MISGCSTLLADCEKTWLRPGFFVPYLQEFTESPTRHHPNGFNVGMNCGEAAGQMVMPFHCHVIPRYSGDMADPRGGVREVIPKEQSYYP